MQIFAYPFFLTFLVACIGASLGSFITLLSYRLPRDQPIGMTRSRCPSCKTNLGVPDLFPIFSWLWQRGKCRHCKTNVHWRYPLTEIISSAIFILIWLQYDISYHSLAFMLLATLLLTLIIIDFEHYIIPDELQVALALLGITYRLTLTPTHAIDLVPSVALGLGIGWLLHYGYFFLRKKHGLGMGDVKFLAVAGLWLQPQDLISFFIISGVLGVLTGMAWQICGLGKKFPFGPALAVTLFLQLLFPETTNMQHWIDSYLYATSMP